VAEVEVSRCFRVALALALHDGRNRCNRRTHLILKSGSAQRRQGLAFAVRAGKISFLLGPAFSKGGLRLSTALIVRGSNCAGFETFSGNLNSTAV